MTKREFIDALNARTAALSREERERLADYYGEIIDDSIEEGVPEAEAVAALGSLDDLVGELAAEHPAQDFTAAAERLEDLKQITIRVLDADVAIARESLGNGAAAQFRVSEPGRFKWMARGDALEIVENRIPRRGLIPTRQASVSVAFDGATPERLTVESRGGDVALSGIEVSGPIVLNTGSGDVRLTDLRCGCVSLVTRSGDADVIRCEVSADLRVNAASGDVTVRKTDVAGELSVESASGDIGLRGARARGISCRSASGDLEFERVDADSVTARTASGDAQMTEVSGASRLTVETASGDIDAHRCASADMWLVAASGDIDARLPNLPGKLRIDANTRFGRIHVPKNWTPPAGEDVQRRFSARTVSGSIDVTIVD